MSLLTDLIASLPSTGDIVDGVTEGHVVHSGTYKEIFEALVASGGDLEWVNFADFDPLVGTPGHACGTAMRAAITHAEAIGAAGIRPPLSLFPFELDDRVDLKTVDIKCYGKKNTKFLLTDPDAGIDFTAIDSVVAGVYAGHSSGFEIDADGIAWRPMVVGRRVSSAFSDIRILNPLGDLDEDGVGLLLWTTQNSIFMNVVVVSGRVCVRFDCGAGNNAFYKSEVAGASWANVEFRATHAPPVGHFAYTFYNSFNDTVIEGTLATTKYMVYTSAGALNRLSNVPISANGSIIGGTLPTDMDYAVWCDTVENIQASIVLDDVKFTGSNVVGVAYGANFGTAARIQVRGGSIGACDWPGQGNILVESEPWIFGSVTAGWLTGAGVLGDPRTEHRQPTVYRTNSTGIDIINSRVVTDTAERYAMNTDGTFGYGDGTNPFDIIGGRLVAGVYGLASGHFKIGDWNQSHIVSNAGDHMWINGGKLWINPTAPTSGTDGTVVGTQT